MKKMLILLLMGVYSFVNAQELPSVPADGFSFPIGSKFTIKLIPIDSIHFEYSVIAFENFHSIANSHDYSDFFDEKGEQNTISFCFCYGSSGETDEEQEKNMKIHLFMKNYTSYHLNYTSEIQLEEDGEFTLTSNVGTFSGALGNEIWPYMIYFIALSDFKIMKMEVLE